MHMPFSYTHDPKVPDFDDSHPIAVMDADCALCSKGARMIHRADPAGTIRICPVQSPLGRALLHHYGLRPDDPTSWLLLDKGRAYEDLDAVMQLCAILGGWARVAAVLKVLPKPLRVWIYRRVANNRYALFGHEDLCALPDPAFQRRLMR